jgi:hypothetical protein
MPALVPGEAEPDDYDCTERDGKTQEIGVIHVRPASLPPLIQDRSEARRADEDANGRDTEVENGGATFGASVRIPSAFASKTIPLLSPLVPTDLPPSPMDFGS